MLRLLTLIVAILIAAVAADTRSAAAQNGVVTFKFTNSASYIIYMRMFSQDRSWAWPGGDRGYVLDDRNQHSFALQCVVGEKICYGGSYRGGDSQAYWGLGIEGTRGCTSCCLRCGTPVEDIWSSWNLTD